MLETTVTLHGPLFDGSAATILHRAIDDCRRHMADTAEEVWQAYMDASFRHPTGYYQSHINIAQRSQDLVVNDRGVIYGFWLEGIGSRNSPVTRFPGYFAARRATQHVNEMARSECEPILDRAVHEING